MCLLNVCLFVMPWNSLWWVAQACKVAIMNLFLPCPEIPLSESVYKTCYIYMGAIISSVPFWIMFSKEVLFYDFSIIVPCLCLLWYVHVAFCLLALNSASWCCFWHVSIFTKFVKLISFALLPCLFEPVLVWISCSPVFMFCQASLVHNCHMLCCYVGVL